MVCEACKGDGRGIENGLWVKCGTCSGTGQQPVDPELELEPKVGGGIPDADPALDSSIVREDAQ